MQANINDFRSSFIGELARPSRFDVNIPIPLSLLPYIKNSRSLTYRCENTHLPGRTFATTEQKIYGPVTKHPYLTTYNDIDMTFIVTDRMDEKLFFDAWLEYVNPSYNYNFAYKSDYSTVLTVTQYDVSNKTTYSVNLLDAYPVSMNQLDLNWSSDGYHKLNITFAYGSWQNNSLQSLGMQFVQAGISNAVDVLGGLGGSATAGISSLINGSLNSVSLQNTNQAVEAEKIPNFSDSGLI